MTTKKQHWLPCSYLQYFSITGIPAGRRSVVFWTDGIISSKGVVERLAASNYTYSRSNPSEAERKFHEMENDYTRTISELLQAKVLRKMQYFSLILTMFDFHLRNVAYENRTDSEYIDVYEQMSRNFIACVFADIQSQGTDLNTLGKHLTKYWRLHPVQSFTEKFITSDNPSLVFGETETIAAIFLPVHPNLGVLAFDKRKLSPKSSHATIDDVALLNGFQVQMSIRHVFSDHDLSKIKDDWKALQNIANRAKPERWSDEATWHPGFIPYAGQAPERLSFIEFTPSKGVMPNRSFQPTKKTCGVSMSTLWERYLYIDSQSGRLILFINSIKQASLSNLSESPVKDLVKCNFLLIKK